MASERNEVGWDEATHKMGETARAHELYHHLAYINDVEIPERTEEKAANSYSKAFMTRHSISR
jgi:hypothetical protein